MATEHVAELSPKLPIVFCFLMCRLSHDSFNCAESELEIPVDSSKVIRRFPHHRDLIWVTLYDII